MTDPQPRKLFGLWSGVGLVIANMVGTGVFLSFGFMAQSLPPGPIMLTWIIGAVLALSGAWAYAEVKALAKPEAPEIPVVHVGEPDLTEYDRLLIGEVAS